MNTKAARPSVHEGDTMERLTRIGTAAMALFRCVRGPMKYLAAVALILSLGVVAAHAQGQSVKMTFSGTSAPSTINLVVLDKTGSSISTSSDGDNFAGEGSLGAVTVTNVRAIANYPGTPSTCSGPTQLFLPELAGAGVFRFQDGSLLNLKLIEGGDCIDVTTNTAHCTVTFQIKGGTGRFKNASGVLTMTETVETVVTGSPSDPVFFAATGEFTGTISGVATDQNPGQE